MFTCRNRVITNVRANGALMAGSLKRRVWIRWAAVVAAIYASLWAATLVFGPEATRRLAQRKHVEYYTKSGWNPASSKLVCTSISVPAPFIINALWSTKEFTPDGRLAGSGTWGESRTIWAFGWTLVVSERNVGVYCGAPAPSR